MRVLGRDCGCGTRRDIIFTQSQLGVPEATILVASVLAIIVAMKFGRRTVNAVTE
jgi:hypothetical protein